MSIVALLTVATFTSACGSDDNVMTRPPRPVATAEPPVVAPAISSIPTPRPFSTPRGVRFNDTDPTIGQLDGDVTIEEGSASDTVTSYALYWADQTGARISPIAQLPYKHGTVTYRLRAAPPAAARSVVAFTKNGAGENPMGSGALIPDGVDRDVALPLPPGSGRSAIFDTKSRKLLVARYRGLQPSSPVGSAIVVSRCDLDGTACTHFEPSAGLPVEAGATVGMAFDPTGEKLFFAARSAGGSRPLVVFRCDLDGTACTSTLLPDVRPAASPSVAVDSTRGKIIVAASSTPLLVTRCNLDVTGCEVSEVTVLAGQAPVSSGSPSLAVDEARGRVQFVREGGIIVCDADLTACSHTKLKVGTETIALDPTTGRIAVAGCSGVATWLSRCAGDGTGCTTTSLLPTGAIGRRIALTLDPGARKFVLLLPSSALLAMRCDVEADACSSTLISDSVSSDDPNSVFDTVTKRLVSLSRVPAGILMNTAGPWPP